MKAYLQVPFEKGESIDSLIKTLKEFEAMIPNLRFKNNGYFSLELEGEDKPTEIELKLVKFNFVKNREQDNDRI